MLINLYFSGPRSTVLNIVDPSGHPLPGTPLLFSTHVYEKYIQNRRGVPGRRGPWWVYNCELQVPIEHQMARPWCPSGLARHWSLSKAGPSWAARKPPLDGRGSQISCPVGPSVGLNGAFSLQLRTVAVEVMI